ncbi:MAG: DUF885 domain-containing protein [Erysipelotrichales bacterium]|nr:DUF885 domain-containing protein [Erysipelotrichales bacterium]
MKKYISLFLVAVLSFSLVACSPDQDHIQKEFDEFVEKDLKEMVEDNYSAYHIYFENPQDYGFEKKNIDIDFGEVPNDENYDEAREDIKEFEKELNRFDRDMLNEIQQDIYDQMVFDLSITKELSDEKFEYMYNYFEPMGGVHYQYESFFADFKMRDEEDVQDYIQLMQSFQPYIDDVLEYTKIQAKKGLMSIDFKEVLDRVDNVLKLKDQSSILKQALAHIDELKLDSQKTEDYKKQVKDVFMNSYLQAMKNIQKTLNELKSQKNNKEGLVKLKNGKEYYEVLYKQAIGNDRSVNDMKKLLNSYAKNAFMKMMGIQIQNPNIYESVRKMETKYTDYESILKDLNEKIKNDFPSFGNIDYRIQPLSKDLANPGIAAYFNIPALDSTQPREMFVNTNKYEESPDTGNTKAISTFQTVAHEGIPGHMYQYDHYYRSQESDWLKLQSNLGFVEGYATYVETQVLDYLSDEISQDVLDYCNYESIYVNCIVALFDIAIHYDGLSHDEAMDFLKQNGLVESEELYQQIQANPTAFIPYYAGYIEIMELRKKAESELGNKFNELDFHNALLKTGSVCYDIIEKDVQDYIDETK